MKMNGMSDLPSHSSAVEEKRAQKSHGAGLNSWTRPVYLAIPGVRTRRLRVLIPNLSFLFPSNRGAIIIGNPPPGSRIMLVKRRRTPLLLAFATLAIFLTLLTLFRHRGSQSWVEEGGGESPTLVFRRKDLQKIWEWEIESGHYPSHANIPIQIGLKKAPVNRAIPKKAPNVKPTRYRSPNTRDIITDTTGAGPKRVYLDIQSHSPDVAYPPRPVPGSVADMDEIMRHCDFSQDKYVRDCLEVLRIGGGLDNGERLRRANLDDWKYIYVEETDNTTDTTFLNEIYDSPRTAIPPAIRLSDDPDAGLAKKSDAEWERQVILGPTLTHRPASTLSEPCDPENPRVFHMFWTGAFTDKPYLAILSFLFTQNTGIHLSKWPTDAPVCRPEFWLWINPGPAAAVPNPNAVHDMFAQLKSSPWASPFLHPRFKDVIKFKMWNTTEQLDGIPEIKDEWRALQDSLFNSGGHIISVPQQKKKASQPVTTTSSLEDGVEDNATVATAHGATGSKSSDDDDDDMLNRTGSKSSSSYDRLSVILSDMARFVLCHRFGGVYLDADTLLLRDWEEMWGWKGAFAYRWSRLPKYNTAVLRMHKGSALGTFLFRTALKNGLDFHPMTVSRYTADAHLEGLLLRLPDALFDSAWLNTENYQRDRPPQPYFTEFGNFFDTPVQNSAAPQALGFRGFFRGAYSYHFHNFWWKPFDPTRNWPDLGSRFKPGEDAAKAALVKDGKLTAAEAEAGGKDVLSDKRDLDWSAVLKRTFEAYVRGERPNMYGEWVQWGA
ncbi:snoRNA binding protein [Macrolepiota fuliginosa MF-IS2]|uniref:SnoRNA binding protein n=1 Tax=Macrolepiota fuliginosa MF-IS2 TaxID=1400762 RepID=A0A9P5XGR5_9AGAR|nr:snoRNA binding protein [Macrolepiota fuliginosa MF-IS2]